VVQIHCLNLDAFLHSTFPQSPTGFSDLSHDRAVSSIAWV
jgi:hypothetical protein